MAFFSPLASEHLVTGPLTKGQLFTLLHDNERDRMMPETHDVHERIASQFSDEHTVHSDT